MTWKHSDFFFQPFFFFQHRNSTAILFYEKMFLTFPQLCFSVRVMDEDGVWGPLGVNLTASQEHYRR